MLTTKIVYLKGGELATFFIARYQQKNGFRKNQSRFFVNYLFFGS